ncbi:MAG: NfeD family protein [Thiothrix sp.]|uniref:NfeD family protein n=1 Tax=Thiothrix sp. TaxID=1032 RepID=UPI002636DE85|nr:NfeD family protein [Thiothrix sp.]MDD5394826.1 NfeD family protein [Thiothrix sp.]
MEQEKQEITFAQRLRDGWQNVKQTNLRAQAHYVVFRTAQHIKQQNSLWLYYQQRFVSDWLKWLGIGAGLTGLLMLLNPDGIWRWQLLWIVLGVLSAPLLTDLVLTLQTLLTEYPGKHFIGQVITLEQGITDGKGSTRLDNQLWQLAGSDCPPQTQVRIIAINDRTLYVTPLNQVA